MMSRSRSDQIFRLAAKSLLPFVLMLGFALPSLAQARPASRRAQPAATFDQLSQRAVAVWQSGDLPQAVTLFRKALKLRPDWPEGWGYLAASLYTLKRFPEAREAYRHTTELTPNNGASWAFLGLCDFEVRDYKDAFHHLIKARQLGMGAGQQLIDNVTYHMGLLWDTAGEFQFANHELAKLADRGDSSPEIIEATGLVVLHMPIFPYELPAAKRSVVMSAGKAGWAENAHHNAEAKQLYRQLVADYPKEPGVHFAYGEFLANLDPPAAVTEYLKEIEVNPSSVSGRLQAAFLYMKMGEMEKAEPLARAAAKLQPQNFAPHYLLGRILVEMDHVPEAIQELETASKRSPYNPNIHLSLAQAYQRAGKTAQAEQEMRVFKQLDEKRKREEAAMKINQ